MNVLISTIVVLGLICGAAAPSLASTYKIVFDDEHAEFYKGRSLHVRQGCRLGGGSWTHNDSKPVTVSDDPKTYKLTTDGCKKDPGQANKRRHVKYVEVKIGVTTCKVDLNTSDSSVDRVIRLHERCPLPPLPLHEAVPDQEVRTLAPVFDFDGDGCFPAAGVRRDGTMNGGLKVAGSKTGGCRRKDFMDRSNTLHRKKCESQDGHEYCVHAYALYFEKDQMTDGATETKGMSHRHDWEYVAIWTKDGTITHAGASGHGEVKPVPFDKLPVDAAGRIKVVYHQDGGRTHALRFAKKDEGAENPYGRFVTPPIASWSVLKGDGKLDNAAMQDHMNRARFGAANLPVSDKQFEKLKVRP